MNGSAYPAPGDVTALLRRSRGGDKSAFDALVPFVHSHLEVLASSCLRSARADQTLRTTALVNEAYLKLAGSGCDWADRGHFFVIASRAMRQILVDYARTRKRAKRGGGVRPATFDEAAIVSPNSAVDVMVIDDLLVRLDEFDARKSRALELTYFGGLTGTEAAEALGVSEATLFRELKLAKAWMRQQLRGTAGPAEA